KGGIVPHHLVSAHTVAAFFDSIASQNPSVIVLIGPNHFSRGQSDFLTTKRDWQTPFGAVETDTKIQNKLLSQGVIAVDETAIKEEHSVYALIPFIHESAPNANVLPIIIKESATPEMIDELVMQLHETLPKDAVIVASIDFSHYQYSRVAEFHDELSINVIETGDIARIPQIEIDAHNTLAVFMKLMQAFGTQRVAASHHTNSGVLTGALHEPETTSHYVGYFVKGEPLQEKAVSILQFGDMMLDRNVQNRMEKNGGPDYLFTHVAGREHRFFQGVDIVTANLEGPFADVRRPTTKSIAFRFDPALIPTLQKYGFNLFTLANNHTLDMGKLGFEETKKNLAAAGIPYYGNEFYVQDDSLLIQDIAGKKIAFLGLNDTHNSLDAAEVDRLIQKAEAEADVTIVNIHWGVEYEPLSHPRQRSLAHSYIDAGVDIVIGHHPHVVQEMEVYNGKPIFYSLGNFIFDQYFSVPTQESLGVGMVIYNEGLSLYVFPLEGVQSQVRQMEYKKAQTIFSEFIDRSRLGSYTFDSNFHLFLPMKYGTNP
ncbi:MAG: AmmeMemoRadiSam system protein B, partial [Candidatus Magasanikbacteria bacterium]|nr:AmmeMemoRadiSam system protein B [Candidatus Magasanikbacteria bacterium]